MDYFHQESERLIYRKLTYDDQKSWEEFFVNNDRIHFLGLDPTKSKEELSKETMDKQLSRYKEDGNGLLAVIEKVSGNLIGLCGILTREIKEKKEYEIGYSIKPAYWKKGYATEAAKQMKDFGLKTKLSNRFISIIHKDNEDSFAVARKNGMNPYLVTKFMNMDVVIYAS
jgi:ribosomal-protein-alanine N-acetyltransferase